MDDLVAFLRARLDEDEATAKAARPDLGHLRGWVEISDAGTRADEAHVLRHEPSRALREVEAKRAILAEHEPWKSDYNPHLKGPQLACTTCGVPGEWWDEPWPCDTLKTLAAVYSDHPDYREEWKP